MRKFFLLAALCCPVLAYAQTTTYTGTVRDLTGTVVTSGKITWQLNAPSGGVIPGTGSFASSIVSCTIDASGHPVAVSDGVSPCVVTSNTALTPTGTSYTMCTRPSFVSPGSCIVTYATGGTVDISTIVPTPATQPSYGVASTNIANTWTQPQAFTGALNIALPGVFTNSQMNQTTISNLNGLTSGAFAAVQGGNKATEALTGAALVPVGATVFQMNALAGYIQNNSATVNAVGVYPQVNAGVNGAKLWGANPVVSDFDLSGAIHTSIIEHGIEIDVNALGVGTTGDGILFQGNLSGNTSIGNIGAMHIAAPFAGKWNYGLIIDDSSMFTGSAGLQLGAQGPTSANSYPIILASRNSGSTRLVNAFFADGSGLIHLQGTSGSVIDGGELFSKPGTSAVSAAAGDVVLYNGNFLRSDSTAHNATYRLIGSVAGTAVVNIDPDAQGAMFNGTVSSLAGVIISPTDTGVHGTGVKFQKSDGTGASGNCAKFAADGSVTDAGGPCASAIANVQITTGITAVPATTCTASTATTMTGVATTSAVISPTPTTDTSAVTGWGSSGGLVFTYWVTANTFNWRVCNPTTSSITPGGSVTWNVGAR